MRHRTEHEPGLLNQARVYLSGPMYYGGEAHGEGEGGWRTRVADFLEGQGATVFNPWQKPTVRGVGEYGREGDMGQPYRNRWTFDDSTDGAVARAYCRERARPMMHIDLRMIDTSDLMIAFCPTNIYSVGTVHEIVLARQQKKPVLFVTPPIQLPALHALREHLADDDRARELLARLEAEGPLRANPTGIPSSWYMAILDSENFFDGFGFADVRDDFPHWRDTAFDSLESTNPPKRRSSPTSPTSPPASPPTSGTRRAGRDATTTGSSSTSEHVLRFGAGTSGKHATGNQRVDRQVYPRAVRKAFVAAGAFLAGRRLYRLAAAGKITLDTGIGRRVQPLGPLDFEIAAPREVVFDVIAAPYLHRTPRALQSELSVWERGTDMVLAAHFTQVKCGTTTTVETVRFERPERIHFRVVRGPVPHVVESFALTETPGGTRLTWQGQLGADFWAAGSWWGARVARQWDRAVRRSMKAVTAEAERRARRSS